MKVAFRPSPKSRPRACPFESSTGVTPIQCVAPESEYLSRRPLEGFLAHHGITYVFLGRELGGRPTDRALYTEEGWADYERIRETALFREGLERLWNGLERYTIALLCGEEDPLDCHRGLMICPALVERGLSPRHIRKGARLETTAAFAERVQSEAGVGALFGMAEAYRLLNARKAFRLEEDGV